MTEDQRKITDLVEAMNSINKDGSGNPKVYYDGDYVVLRWEHQETRHNDYVKFIKYVLLQIADQLADERAKSIAYDIVKTVMAAIGVQVINEEDLTELIKESMTCH